MHAMNVVALSAFVLSWFGAAGAWAVGAYSVLRVWTDGPFPLVQRARTRALKAGAVSATFIVTGLIAGMTSGLFNHLHV